MLAVQAAVMKGRGGVFSSLFHYARMFDAVGVRSLCLYRGPAAEPLRAAGLDVIEAPPSLTSPLFPLTPDLGRLRAEIRARGGGDPDFVMAHSDRAMPALRRMFPKTIMMTRCHSDNIKHKRGADLVVTLNPPQQEMVQSGLPGVRVRMLGNPFAPDPGEPGPSDAPGPGGRMRVNFIGRVEQVKDPLTLVRAFGAAKLPPDTQLRIIGAGSQETDVRAAGESLGARFTMTGWASEPFSHFDRGDVLALPSEWESYSWVIREALHHGVPVIASDIFVHRDALDGGKYGLLFPVGDAGALARALEHASHNMDDIRARAAQGRHDLMAQYGAQPFWAKLSAEIADIRRGRTA
jgi:glycosyltransferase involved in cell wall biosynthesis